MRHQDTDDDDGKQTELEGPLPGAPRELDLPMTTSATSRRFQILSEARLSFEGCVQRFSVGGPIRIADGEELMLLVTLHDRGAWPRTATLVVSVEAVHPDPEDPTILLGVERCAVRITESDVAPAVSAATIRGPVGSRIRVLLAFKRGTEEPVGPRTANISVDLLATASGPLDHSSCGTGIAG